MGLNYFNNNICLLVIQRAFGAQNIFLTPLDYKFYLKLMRRYKEIFRIKVFAFCLLPAAIYIVVGGEDSKAVAEFFSEINRSFCDFITVRDQARASLCIQRSRMLVVDDDQALFDLITFVESFPVKRAVVSREQDYEWSSFRLRAFGIDNGMIEKLDLCP
jgi:hypothetical protein